MSTNAPIAKTQLRSTRNNVHPTQNAHLQATNKLTWMMNNAGTETVSRMSAQLSFAAKLQCISCCISSHDSTGYIIYCISLF